MSFLWVLIFGNMVRNEEKTKYSCFIYLFCFSAYYPVYENRRNEYVDNFWRIINWPVVSQLYTEVRAKRADL